MNEVRIHTIAFKATGPTKVELEKAARVAAGFYFGALDPKEALIIDIHARPRTVKDGIVTLWQGDVDAKIVRVGSAGFGG